MGMGSPFLRDTRMGGDLTFLGNQMPHPGDELPCEMPLSQGGGWVKI